MDARLIRQTVLCKELSILCREWVRIFYSISWLEVANGSAEEKRKTSENVSVAWCPKLGKVTDDTTFHSNEKEYTTEKLAAAVLAFESAESAAPGKDIVDVKAVKLV